MELPIPVIQEADVLLVGGTLAGCALAPRLRRAGRRVVMACEDVALGTDCAGVLEREAQSAFPGLGPFATPGECQEGLERLLLGQGVTLHFGAFPLRPLRERGGRRIAGWVFLGQEGSFAIAAKAVVDATREGRLPVQARLLRPPAGLATCRLHWNLLGSAPPRENEGIRLEASLSPVHFPEGCLPLCHCQRSLRLREDDMPARLEAEAALRLALWTPSLRQGARWCTLESPAPRPAAPAPTAQAPLFSAQTPCAPAILQATLPHLPMPRQLLAGEHPRKLPRGTELLPLPQQRPQDSPTLPFPLECLVGPAPDAPLVILGAEEAGQQAAPQAARQGRPPLLLEESGLPHTPLHTLQEARGARLWLHCRPAGLLLQDRRLAGILVVCATGESRLVHTPRLLDTRTTPRTLLPSP